MIFYDFNQVRSKFVIFRRVQSMPELRKIVLRVIKILNDRFFSRRNLCIFKKQIPENPSRTFFLLFSNFRNEEPFQLL